MASPVYERNWADLTRELLYLILDRLVLLPDFIRFGAVCKPWRLATVNMQKERSISCYQEPPMLLIPAEDGSKDHRRLYSIWEDKIYPYLFEIPHRRRCCGSSYGWWVFAEEDGSFNFSVTLLNPFSRTTISLPTIMNIPLQERGYHDPEYFLHKVVLSCDPCLHPRDWVAFAIVGLPKKVAFIRSGEGSWTPLRNPGYYGFFPVKDVCFCQGKLYAVDGRYKLVAFDFSQMRDDGVTKINPSIKSPHPVVDEYSSGSYLVELGGDLLLVRKIFPEIDGDLMDFETTVGFKVRKLSYKQESTAEADADAEWIDVLNLGEFSLFLGDNLSVSIHACNFPHCKPNCIYYTDDCKEKDDPDGPYEADDMGIFDLATGEITRYYALDPSHRYMPPAVWISPKLGQPLQS